MSFIEAIKSAFSKYADFKGRARRSEYWYFCLFNSVAGMLLMFIFFPLGILFSLAMICPGLALLARRLHDMGKSAWTYWMVIIPIVGPFIILYYLIQDSEPGENKWGANPKGM